MNCKECGKPFLSCCGNDDLYCLDCQQEFVLQKMRAEERKMHGSVKSSKKLKKL